MKIKSIIAFLAYVLLLSSFIAPAVACPPPDCGDCYYPDGDSCIPYGDCWGGCPTCESCVSCYCQCTSECCKDVHCGDPDCYDCVSCECVPVEVNSVSSDNDIACVGCDITFTATTSPSGYESGVSWSAPGGDPNSGSGSSFSTSWDTPGPNTVTASICDSNDSKQVTIVAVDKIQYNDPDTGYTDITGTLYVYKGTSVTFKAIPDPCDASWPSGKPIWGGTSGASGTGETKNVTFNTKSSSPTDYKTVTATCGNTVTANVIVCEVEVTHIQFDHDDPAGGHHDALDIRENYSTDISVPEWVKGGQNKPAAYIESLSNVDIKAKFSISPGVDPGTKILATTNSSIMGDVGEESVSFSSGVSSYVRFTTNSGENVGKGTVQWQWKVKDLGHGSGEININTSGAHTIYLVLATPTAPQAEAWTEALDISCSEAAGMTTAAGATWCIWDDFYYSAGGSYDIGRYKNSELVAGAPEYTSDGESSAFNLTKWLGQYPSVGIVNCYDMGKAVVVFANALGCGAVNSYVGNFGYLNCVCPIGRSWTNNPFYNLGVLDPNTGVDPNPIVSGDWGWGDGRTGFGNHAFARLISGDIYDASGGKVDVDGDPDDGPPHTAHDLDGDDTWTNDYDGRVIDPAPNDYGNPSAPQDNGFSVY